jgi:hypothetical protein
MVWVADGCGMRAHFFTVTRNNPDRQAAAEVPAVPRPLGASALRLQWCAAHGDSCRSARHEVPQGSSHHVADIGRSSSPVAGISSRPASSPRIGESSRDCLSDWWTPAEHGGFLGPAAIEEAADIVKIRGFAN